MQKFSIFMLLLCAALQGFAQEETKRPSPPAEARGQIGNKTVTINYGQPSVKGRKIWGELVPYGKVWRAGANETTSITFSEDVKIEGEPLAAGTYAFFVIPNEKKWTIIFNKTVKWGAFSYKEEEDVLRVTVPVRKSKAFTEKLTYEVNPRGSVKMQWEKVAVKFKVK